MEEAGEETRRTLAVGKADEVASRNVPADWRAERWIHEGRSLREEDHEQ